MGFRISYLSNYHNSTYIESAYINNQRRFHHLHLTSYLFDGEGNALCYDYGGLNRVIIFQVDGENIFYDRKNI